MQVFKAFMKVSMKRFHISMIYIVIFVSICVAMTLSSEKSSGFESSRLSVSITDLDNSESSRALADYITKTHDIVEVSDDKDEILDALYYQRADIILTINEGYEQKLAKGETDTLFSDYRVPGTFAAEYFDTQMNQYISTVKAYTASGLTVSEAHVKAAELAKDSIEVEMPGSTDEESKSSGNSFTMFFQYLAYIVIAVFLSGACPAMLVMFGREIKNRTNCSCVSVTSQITQIFLGNALFSLMIYLILLVAAAILFGGEFFTLKGLLAVLNGLSYVIFAIMLTLMIAVMSPNPKTVDMISNVISLGMSFLCGVFVPQSLLSDTVLGIGKFLPAYWYVKAVNIITGSDGEVFSTSDAAVCMLIQLAFAIVIFAVTLILARTKNSSETV